jgi:hypothetical protein
MNQLLYISNNFRPTEFHLTWRHISRVPKNDPAANIGNSTYVLQPRNSEVYPDADVIEPSLRSPYLRHREKFSHVKMTYDADKI